MIKQFSNVIGQAQSAEDNFSVKSLRFERAVSETARRVVVCLSLSGFGLGWLAKG